MIAFKASRLNSMYRTENLILKKWFLLEKVFYKVCENIIFGWGIGFYQFDPKLFAKWPFYVKSVNSTMSAKTHKCSN